MNPDKSPHPLNTQCLTWVHKTTGKHCTKGLSNGAVTYMHPLTGPAICVKDADLNNSALWEVSDAFNPTP